MIHQKVHELIGLFTPQDFAIEAPFFGKNVQSMLKLGRAQGVAIATAMQAGLPVTEYSPKKVKQSITGNGNSEKQQVWKMLQHILRLEEQESTATMPVMRLQSPSVTIFSTRPRAGSRRP